MVMMAHAFGQALVAAGLITAEELNQTCRIVIDAVGGEPVMIYTQKIGDKDGLEKLVPMLKELIPSGQD
jgi:hypothetical protein